jgi:hypothetical protein
MIVQILRRNVEKMKAGELDQRWRKFVFGNVNLNHPVY